MTLVGRVLERIYVDLGMLFDDGVVSFFGFSRERGDDNDEPHINGHYKLRTTLSDADAMKQERKNMKKLVTEVRLSRTPPAARDALTHLPT